MLVSVLGGLHEHGVDPRSERTLKADGQLIKNEELFLARHNCKAAMTRRAYMTS